MKQAKQILNDDVGSSVGKLETGDVSDLCIGNKFGTLF